MYQISSIPEPRLTTAPASEPVSAAEVKNNLNLSGSDHDTLITHLIKAARQQFEFDTQMCLITRTYTLDLPYLDEWQFSQRPVASITSIKYYDLDNTQQTLSTDVYSLAAGLNQIRLDYNQNWPSTITRWDAVEVIYVVGSTSAEQYDIAKQAILLLISRDWYDREDMSTVINQRYESLVTRFMRSSYP